MKLKQHNNISENQIEEVLVRNLIYLRNLLGLDSELRLIARQLWIKNRHERIDLILSHRDEIVLIELKVTKFSENNLEQILSYKTELERLQCSNSFINGKIKSFLLVTHANKKQIDICNKEGINLIIYEPLDILENYFTELTTITKFLSIKPNDYGLYNLGLMNRTLLDVNKGEILISKISSNLNLSKNSIKHHLKVASELNLIRERDSKFFLTDLGDIYVSKIDKKFSMENLNEEQSLILKNFIAKYPFYSSTVFGIYSIVESAFLLSRSYYPIQFDDLKAMFKIISGKQNEWISDRSISTATYTFLNFSINLELLGKIGKQVVITPSGFNFILMLQLHKSIEMIDSINK